jgi:hypothetical protein
LPWPFADAIATVEAANVSDKVVMIAAREIDLRIVNSSVDLTWLSWTKRYERIAWKGAGHAKEEVQRGADCDAASPD